MMKNTENLNLAKQASIVEIQTLLQQAIDNDVLPGAVVLVNHNGNTVYQQAFGMADREAGRSQHVDDLFYLGSTSKPLAVTSILTLVNSGKLDLDEPASSWIPELSHCKLKQGRVSRPPTLGELLSHTSGLFGNASATPRQQRLVWNFGSSLAHTATQIARQTYNYEPGQGFSYGGASMTIASRIAELVTGLEFDEFADTAVFAKLQMKDTFYRTGRDFKNRFSTLYKKSARKSARNMHKAQFQPHATPDSFVLPAGGIISTAHDLASFLQLHLDNGASRGEEILCQELVLKMRTDATNGHSMDFRSPARNKSTAGIANNDGYGLGWMLDEINENRRAKIFFHGGAFGTLVWGDSDAQLGVVLLTHIPLAEVAQLWDMILNIIRQAWAQTVR